MSANASFNYVGTSNAPGTFNTTSDGYVQGSFLPDPAIRYQLAGGILAPTEALPMYGGVAISENINPNGAFGVAPAQELGGYVGRATQIAPGATGSLTGFCVFDQNYAAPITTASAVPMSGSNMLVNFFRLGSRARIVVACDNVLTALEGGNIGQQVSWDFAGQQLVPYVAAYPQDSITAATWASTSGGQATLTTSSAHGIAPGDVFTISGITPSAYNGTFTALSGTTGSTIVYSLPEASTPGNGTAFGFLAAGGGALPVKILTVSAANAMVVNYNALTNVASWNYNGSVAVIEI